MTDPTPPSPRVSVAISICNAERYIGEAVESVLNQTFGDFELIIIDDGSTDGTADLLRRYAEADDRIRLTIRDNRGIPQSLNEAIDLSRGEYTARMDGDDICLPQRLERQVAFLDAHPEVVAVGCHRLLIDADGDPINTPTEAQSHEEIDRFLMQCKGAIPHPGAMIRTAALKQIGGYRAKFTAAQDLDLWLRLGELGELANLPDVLLRYRVHAGGVSQTKRTVQLECAALAVRDACERRGLPAPPELETNLVYADDHFRRRRQLIHWAMEAGNRATARKHARAHWRAHRLNPRCWLDLARTHLRQG